MLEILGLVEIRVNLASKEEDVKETMVSKTVRLFTGAFVCLRLFVLVITWRHHRTKCAGPDMSKVPDADDGLLSKAGMKKGIKEQRLWWSLEVGSFMRQCTFLNCWCFNDRERNSDREPEQHAQPQLRHAASRLTLQNGGILTHARYAAIWLFASVLISDVVPQSGGIR